MPSGPPSSTRSRRLACTIGLGLALVGSMASPAGADDVGSLGGQVGSAKSSINKLAADLDRAESKAAATGRAVEDAQRELDAVKAEHAATIASTTKAAIDAYVRGPVVGGASLGGADPLDVVRAQVYEGLARGHQADDLDRLRAASLDLERATTTLRSRLAAQKAAEKAIAAAQERVAANLATLESRLAKAKDQASRDAAARIARQRTAAATAAPGRPAVLPVSGAWTCPVTGPVAFSNDFGNPRYGGGYHTHKGNDLLSPRGTPVVANVSGVFRFNNNRLGGLSYNLTGADGTRYYGAHLDRFSGVSAGPVSQGTVLGYVGNSGDARGGPTHLHFEIHPHGGAAVNPYPTTSRYC